MQMVLAQTRRRTVEKVIDLPVFVQIHSRIGSLQDDKIKECQHNSKGTGTRFQVIGVIKASKDLWNENDFTEFSKFFGVLTVGIFYFTFFLDRVL